METHKLLLPDYIGNLQTAYPRLSAEAIRQVVDRFSSLTEESLKKIKQALDAISYDRVGGSHAYVKNILNQIEPIPIEDKKSVLPAERTSLSLHPTRTSQSDLKPSSGYDLYDSIHNTKKMIKDLNQEIINLLTTLESKGINVGNIKEELDIIHSTSRTNKRNKGTKIDALTSLKWTLSHLENKQVSLEKVLNKLKTKQQAPDDKKSTKIDILKLIEEYKIFPQSFISQFYVIQEKINKPNSVAETKKIFLECQLFTNQLLTQANTLLTEFSTKTYLMNTFQVELLDSMKQSQYSVRSDFQVSELERLRLLGAGPNKESFIKLERLCVLVDKFQMEASSLRLMSNYNKRKKP